MAFELSSGNNWVWALTVQQPLTWVQVCKCLIACVDVWEMASSAVFLCGYLLNDS